MPKHPYLREHPDGVTLLMRVQPKSSRTGPLGVVGDNLKWGLSSAPVDGKANEELRAALAKYFAVKRADVSLIKGEHSRTKTVLIKGISLEDAKRKVSAE